MKSLLAFALLALPIAAQAEHMDVIQTTLTGCSIEEWVETVHDFNEQWGKDHAYKAEALVPLQSPDLASVFWIGRTANAAAFGAAWDSWRDSLADEKSVAAKLQERFDDCGTNDARRSYDVY